MIDVLKCISPQWAIIGYITLIPLNTSMSELIRGSKVDVLSQITCSFLIAYEGKQLFPSVIDVVSHRCLFLLTISYAK